VQRATQAPSVQGTMNKQPLQDDDVQELQAAQPLCDIMQEASNDRYLALGQTSVTLGKVMHSIRGMLKETALLCQIHEQ
jgi:hypothetical protein